MKSAHDWVPRILDQTIGDPSPEDLKKRLELVICGIQADALERQNLTIHNLVTALELVQSVLERHPEDVAELLVSITFLLASLKEQGLDRVDPYRKGGRSE